MRKKILAIMTLFVYSSFAAAMTGEVILRNGHSVSGDIRKHKNGGYWVTDKNGSIKFENDEIKTVKIHSTKDKLSEDFINAMKITPGSNTPGSHGHNTGYDNLIVKESKKNNLDPALVKAVIKTESNFNCRDVSSKGACGLMQLMPETARLMGVKSIFSPDQNIEAGTKYLRYMIDAFNGDISLGLAAYNAGPGTVKRFGKIPPYKETKNYVKDVLKRYRSFGSSGKIQSYTDEKGCLYLFNAK